MISATAVPSDQEPPDLREMSRQPTKVDIVHTGSAQDVEGDMTMHRRVGRIHRAGLTAVPLLLGLAIATGSSPQIAQAATAQAAPSVTAAPAQAASDQDEASGDPDPTTSTEATEPASDLTGSDQEWTTPDLVGQAALVRVETMADIYVAVHHFRVQRFSYTVTDPQATATGTYLDAHGLVVTGRAALHEDDDQEARFATYGINRAFVDAGFLAELPDDPFEPTTITAENKGPLADTPPTDPPADDRLQDCYDQENSYHCAVFVVMRQRVVAGVQDRDRRASDALVRSDDSMAVLSTQPQGLTPLTLQLADPQPGAKYWVLSTRGADQEPLIETGTLTGSTSEPLSQADLTAWSQKFGALAEGAAVISERGDLVAVLTGSGGTGLQAVTAAHIADGLRDFGLTRNSSPVDAQFQDGLELFEASQFAAAVPKLEAAAQASGGQRVVVDLLAQAQELAGTAQDLSDEAGLVTTSEQDRGGWSANAVVAFTGLVVLVLLGAGVALALTHDRDTPERDGGPAGPDPAAPASGSSPGSAVPGTTTEPSSTTATPAGPEPGLRQPDRSTGETSTGDTPAARIGGSGRTTVFAIGTTDPAAPQELSRSEHPDAAVGGLLPDTTGPEPGHCGSGPADTAEEPTLRRVVASPLADGPAADPSAPVTTAPPPPATTDPPAPVTADRQNQPPRETGRFCRRCGSRVSPGDRFCFSCGTPMNASTSAPTGRG